MNLKRHREYIALQDKPIADMTIMELRTIRKETRSFEEFNAAEQELKRRGRLSLTSIEALHKMTGGNIIIES